jgi:hypothetical protein
MAETATADRRRDRRVNIVVIRKKRSMGGYLGSASWTTMPLYTTSTCCFSLTICVGIALKHNTKTTTSTQRNIGRLDRLAMSIRVHLWKNFLPHRSVGEH